jgi:hypothetical protein
MFFKILCFAFFVGACICAENVTEGDKIAELLGNETTIQQSMANNTILMTNDTMLNCTIQNPPETSTGPVTPKSTVTPSPISPNSTIEMVKNESVSMITLLAVNSTSTDVVPVNTTQMAIGRPIVTVTFFKILYRIHNFCKSWRILKILSSCKCNIAHF